MPHFAAFCVINLQYEIRIFTKLPQMTKHLHFWEKLWLENFVLRSTDLYTVLKRYKKEIDKFTLTF